MRTITLYDWTGIVSIMELPAHAGRAAALRIGRAAVDLAGERGWGVEYTSDEPAPVARAFAREIRGLDAHPIRATA